MTMEQQPKPVPTELEVDSLERAESTPPEEAMAELRLADASAGLLTAPSQHEEPAHSPSEPNVTQRLSTLWRSTNLQEWPQLLPLVKILVLLIVAGFGLKLTGAVLGAGRPFKCCSVPVQKCTPTTEACRPADQNRAG
jgi:hypothetical protein